MPRLLAAGCAAAVSLNIKLFLNRTDSCRCNGEVQVECIIELLTANRMLIER
jgi:hypothetical protein